MKASILLAASILSAAAAASAPAAAVDPITNESSRPADAPADSLSFVRLCESLPMLSPAEREVAVADWLSENASDSASYRHFYNIAEQRLYLPDSPQRSEEIFIPFLKDAVDSGKLKPADAERASFRLEMALKNRVGTKAENFSFVLRDGKSESLYSLNPDRDILLLFYNPDCDHCKEVMEEIQKRKLHLKYDVVAIDAEDDRSLWNETAPSLPEEWTVGFASSPVQDEEIYFLPAMPTIYVISPSMSVVAKEVNVSDL